MAILGNIIKGIINIKDTFTSETSPLENQRETLNMLLNKAKDTQFGKFYNFESILEKSVLKEKNYIFSIKKP